MNFIAKNRTMNHTSNGIVSMEKVEIGGVRQGVLIRGENRKNPILLMIHGGPGQSEIYLSHRLNKELEKHFTVVNWDQRGTATSFSKKINPETMNLGQFLKDAEEVIQYVQKKLGKLKEKIYLQGHSFGTILSMLMIKRYPEYFQAYIGIAQVTGLLEAMEVSYQWTLQKAKETANQKALKDLRKIGSPPFQDFTSGLWKYSLWLAKFGGKTYKGDGSDVFKAILSAPEYSLIDKINFFRGAMFSVKHLHKELLATNLMNEVTNVDLSVYFFLGKYDYAAPTQLAASYYETIHAPHKELVWFNESGHVPQYEENEAYTQRLLEIKNAHSTR